MKIKIVIGEDDNEKIKNTIREFLSNCFYAGGAHWGISRSLILLCKCGKKYIETEKNQVECLFCIRGKI